MAWPSTHSDLFFVCLEVLNLLQYAYIFFFFRNRFKLEIVIQAFSIAPRDWYRREQPERNREYLRFVKRFPCIGCGCTWWVDPCHTGPHGLGQKSSAYSALPMCRKCHDAFDQAPRAFAEVHGIDVAGLIEYFKGLWERKVEP